MVEFKLCGWKRGDGTIKLFSGRVFDAWPREIHFLGVPFTLQEVTDLSETRQGIVQNARYE